MPLPQQHGEDQHSEQDQGIESAHVDSLQIEDEDELSAVGATDKPAAISTPVIFAT
jgi:hypothetical protein